MRNLNKILIIQTAYPGDIILSTPFIHAAHQKFGKTQIAILTTPAGQHLLQNNPAIDKIITFDKGDEKEMNFGKVVKIVRANHFDRCYLLHKSFRSGLISFLGKIHERIGFQKASGAAFYTQKIAEPGQGLQVRKYLALIGERSGQEITPRLYPPDEAQKRVDNLLRNEAIKIDSGITICMAPGSAWQTKRYPEQKFILLGRKILATVDNTKIILLGGQPDYELCAEIKLNFGKKGFNLAGKLSFLESGVLLSKCALLIANDSAPGHIASAFNTPVITIFGPTVPELGFAPVGQKNKIAQVPLECRPCGLHGFNQCPNGDHKCMRLLDEDSILALVKDILTG